MSTTTPGWVCVEIGELLRAVEAALLDSMTTLGPAANAGIANDAPAVTLDAETVRALKQSIGDAADLSEQLAALAEQLPDGETRFGYGDVRDGARTDLACGILDPRRALLAAQVLDVRDGWNALAEALASTDVRKAWEDMTLEQMLSRFRGAEKPLVRHALADANLTAELTFADCPLDGIGRLAQTLHQHAGSQPAP